jgi:hypothetical protein
MISEKSVEEKLAGGKTNLEENTLLPTDLRPDNYKSPHYIPTGTYVLDSDLKLPSSTKGNSGRMIDRDAVTVITVEPPKVLSGYNEFKYGEVRASSDSSPS